MNQEAARLQEAREGKIAWRRWGPYLSERQWGTVREDYSDTGNAWDHFSHDQARSRAYQWGEDGLAGVSDDKQHLCFALALWNGKDPILKERLFGLTNSEGNHGEDVKEHYYYLDSTPTHSYMKYLYKYPHAAYPYDDLVQQNHHRTRHEQEYELIDTGIFAESRYFDVFVEYAKADAEDLLISITVHNRGPEKASLHLLPTLWFRNTWSWGGASFKPSLKRIENPGGGSVIGVSHNVIGDRYLYCEGDVPLLFTENDTNNSRVFGTPNLSPYVKDGINDFVVQGKADAINPAQVGTKASPHYLLEIDAGKSRTIHLRLTTTAPAGAKSAIAKSKELLGKDFDAVLTQRLREADEFYSAITPATLDADQRNVMRQSLAGMLWSKQYYFFDLDKWIEGHRGRPARNAHWFHMVNDDIISMPDKWEYPWYAAWDLAFHTVALSMVDLDFAKDQLELMLRELYLHPNGQIPAYEWNFGDVNPPVHAWAVWFVYNIEKEIRGEADITFLKHAFQKLLLNFTWWVNRKDPSGKNVFEGGFLGLDNIGVFDRSAPLPTGGFLEQADGTAWMALFSQNMLDIAVELSAHDPLYEDMALKFVEHFLWIAVAMNRMGGTEDAMWDEADGFYYDLLRLPDGSAKRLKVRSMVGLLPFCAVTMFQKTVEDDCPRLMERARRRIEKLPEIRKLVPNIGKRGVADRLCLSLLDENHLRRVLEKMLDENEFLSPHGIRSLSKFHEQHPYVLGVHGEEHRVDYLPAESNTGMFGGNSNWRGPVWFPVNALIIRALLTYYSFYGDEFTVECPTGSGKRMTLFEVSQDISKRLTTIFLRDENGRRPVFGGQELLQTDPHFRDHIPFYEYFHGDNGAGLGASHQTGWTGLVGRMLQMYGYLDSKEFLERGRGAAIVYRGGKSQSEKPLGEKSLGDKPQSGKPQGGQPQDAKPNPVEVTVQKSKVVKA